MSKDVWHRYDEAPKHQDIIMTDTGCWAYRTDLLALEAENKDLSDKIGKLEIELKRTRKALDVAVDALKSAHEYYEYCIQRDKDYGGDDINWDCTAMNMDNDISEALDQITALEQKDVK